MTHRIKTMILTAGLSVALAGFTLSARSFTTEVAHVPFAFYAQGHWFPAGEYRVQDLNAGGLFQLYMTDGKSIFISAPVKKDSDASNPRLTFRCYGDDRLLAEITTSDGISYSVSQTSQERTLYWHKMAALISVKLMPR